MKILVISHLPFSTMTAMGKTIASLFSSFKKDEICEFYIYPAIPNLDIADSFYRITDKEILASFFGRKTKGSVIKADINNRKWIESNKDEDFYKSSLNRLPLTLFLRDTMWYLSDWFCKDLKNWLKEQKPDCIFVALGDSCFLYRIAKRIGLFLKIPIVSYVCDDYYFVKKSNCIFSLIKNFTLKKATINLFKHSRHIVTICDSLNEQYTDYFNVKATTIMTGSSAGISDRVSYCKKIHKLGFFGKITLNRYVSLYEIGKALDEINKYRHTEYELEIYTPTKDYQILNKFNGINSIKLKGFVTGKEYQIAYESSDVLIHVESFDDKFIDLIKNSVSTKIADILASGKYFIAYGPKNIASMMHLINNKCAGVITKQDKLAEKLYFLLSNPDLLRNYAQNAIHVAKKYHDAFLQSQKLRRIFEKYIKK